MNTEYDDLNKEYWSRVPHEHILSGARYPGDELLERLEKGASVLDVGCGNGKVATYLHDKGYEVTGIDINKAAIEENQKHHPSITYVDGDVTKKLPFASSTFAAAVVPYLFVSIIDTQTAVRVANEVARVVTSGGYIWVCEATYSPDYEVRYQAGKAATGQDGVAVSYTRDANGVETKDIKRFIKHYSEDELRTLFSSFTLISNDVVTISSPHSGLQVNSLVHVYQKTV